MLQQALLSPDEALLAQVLASDPPPRTTLMQHLSAGWVHPKHIPTLYDPVWSLSWYELYDAWATGRHCTLTEAFLVAEPRPSVVGILQHCYSRSSCIVRWCPCCSARLFRYELMARDMECSIDLLLVAFRHTADLPDWLVKLFAHTPIQTLISRLTPETCLRYVHPIAAQRVDSRTFVQALFMSDPPRLLVDNLRRLGIRVKFARLADAVFHTAELRHAIDAHRDWACHISVTYEDARKYAYTIPQLAKYLHAFDVCKLDALRWSDTEAACAAASVLERTDPHLLLSDKTSCAYVAFRSTAIARRRLAGAVALHLLLFIKRRGLWAGLDPWLIRHIVSFLK